MRAAWALLGLLGLASAAIDRTYTEISYSQEGRIGTIKFNNPPYNLVTRTMTEELDDVLKRIEANPSIGSVVLTSDLEGIFLSHYDVEEILELGQALKFQLPPAVIRQALIAESYLNVIPGFRAVLKPTLLGGLGALNTYHSVVRRIRQSSKVFIAAINGRAMGGGAEFAWAADFRVMIGGSLQEGSVLGQPEIVLGIIPGGGGIQMLKRTVGAAKALELCLEGFPLTAEQAKEVGLVNKVASSQAELRSEVHELATRMARRAPTAVRAIKRAVHVGGTLEDALSIEMAAFAETAGIPRAQQALAHYLTKIDTVLGNGIDVESLYVWTNGTEIDLTGTSTAEPVDRGL